MKSKELKKDRVMKLMILAGILVMFFCVQTAFAKEYLIVKTDDPKKAMDSAKKVCKTLGLMEYLTDFKELKPEWVNSHKGLEKVILDSNLDPVKLTGAMMVKAIAKDGSSSVLAISDNKKLAKIKGKQLEKLLKDSGLL